MPTALLLLLLLPLLSLLLLYRHLSRRLTPPSTAVTKPSKKPLPPGSMGYPYVGETFQLYSNNPNTFFADKQRKYGPVFKTHVLGCPCVMVSSPDAARFVLVTKSNLFKPTFPASKERMIGPQAVFFQLGEYHGRLRRLVLRAFMPAAIRTKVAAVEEMAVGCLAAVEGAGVINAYQEMKTYAMNVALLSIFGKEAKSYIEELKQCYYTLEKGYNSMPLNIPGTLFHRAMKSRRKLGALVARIISLRRQTDRSEEDSDDLLASFMDEKESLTDDQIADNVIGVIFAARDTTASVITWVLKYLAENPTVLELVTEEQESIRRRKEGRELDLGDVKNMVYSCKVMLETMRMASILSFTFREAVEDVEYEGYRIPKGWKVLPLFRNIHHSPENFPDPEKFDPSRFEISPKPNTFMPFGNGAHACPGNELAKLEILVLLHHLTTNYRWSLCGLQSGIQFGPFALPLNGLPISIVRKH